MTEGGDRFTTCRGRVMGEEEEDEEAEDRENGDEVDGPIRSQAPSDLLLRFHILLRLLLHSPGGASAGESGLGARRSQRLALHPSFLPLSAKRES